MDSNFIYCSYCCKKCNSDNPPFSVKMYYLCEDCYEIFLEEQNNEVV